ncbi:UNKNOWN [Stylonychia lemnae]|uniref:Uncharacterized protein n=1 Tax=Stylonychia lemnae TaxID=5949 RepID=A0A078A9Q5_STYLE|nr:UNKNOWN [Stylonychia lemnae]|eukprot:CDW78616.1 UNKNOWN [Stylonychia lemnae]
MGGFSSDDNFANFIGTSQNPIVIFINKGGGFRWGVFFQALQQSILAVKFNKDSSQILAVIESEPLSIILMNPDDGTQFGYKENIAVSSRGGGFCSGDCLLFAEDSSSIFLSIVSHGKKWELLKIKNDKMNFVAQSSLVSPLEGIAYTIKSNTNDELYIAGYMQNPADNNNYASLTKIKASTQEVKWNYFINYGKISTDFYYLRRFWLDITHIYACSEVTQINVERSMGIHIFQLNGDSQPTQTKDFQYGDASQIFSCYDIRQFSPTVIHLLIQDSASQLPYLMILNPVASTYIIKTLDITVVLIMILNARIIRETQTLFVGQTMSTYETASQMLDQFSGFVAAFDTDYSCSAILISSNSSPLLAATSNTIVAPSITFTSITYNFVSLTLGTMQIGNLNQMRTYFCNRDVIVTITPVAILDQDYEVASTKKVIDFAAFGVVDGTSCTGHILEYSIEITPVVSFIMIDSQRRKISIYTNDDSKQGQYSIKLTGSIYSQSQHTSFKINVKKVDCRSQPVSILRPTSFIPTVDYYVGSLKAQVQIDNYAFTPTCDYVFSFNIQTNPVSNFLVFNPTTMKIDISTNDPILAKIYTVKILATLNDTLITLDQGYQFQLRILINSTSVINTIASKLINHAPFFVESLQQLDLFVNQTLNYKLPLTKDDDNDTVFIKYELGAASTIITILEGNRLLIKPNLKRDYIIRIILYDNNKNQVYSQTYNLKITVKDIQQPQQNPVTEPKENITEKFDSKLQARIFSINMEGLMIIRYSEDIRDQFINYTTFSQSQILILSVEPSFYKDLELLSFKWQLKSFKRNEMQIRLIFDNPNYVSMRLLKDKIKVVFNEQGYFVALKSGLSIKQNYTITRDLPQQLELTDVSQQINTMGKIFSATAFSFMISNIVIIFFVGGSLQLIWGLINSLQIIVHLPLLPFEFPSNAKSFFVMLFQAARFNFIPPDTFTSVFFNGQDDNEEEPFNQRFFDMYIF